jgi:hypothetical protein
MATGAFAADDPRRALSASDGSNAVATTTPRPAVVHDLSGTPDELSAGGSWHWWVRGQNFVVCYTFLVAGDPLEITDVPDEHMILLADDAHGEPVLEVCTGVAPGQPARVAGQSLVIAPPGTTRVTSTRDLSLLRVFSARAEDALARARNGADYTELDGAVTTLPANPRESGPGTLRVHRMSDVADDPSRLGRIFRSDSLLVNWFAPQVGARDVDRLSPHVHDAFEQASVTLRGDYVHHFRTPWTPRLRDWRSDEHHTTASPSIALIPPGIVHTTRAVGDGLHVLIDVFAPPREDFREQSWVLNDDDYLPAP